MTQKKFFARMVLLPTWLAFATAANRASGEFGLLPEFTGQTPAEWINSEPLTTADLHGRVVLLDFWTFDCWNCYRSFPWLLALEERFSDMPFTVIGIQSPEFAHEHRREAVAAKTSEFGLRHPVMLDNDHRYWKALRNRYWPAYYLVDKQGRIRQLYIGETHSGDARALRIETDLRALLAE